MKINKSKILTGILILVAILQMFVIAWINLSQGRYHLGTDSSSNYLKAYEFWKQRTLVCDNWVNTTTLFWDLPAPIAAVFLNFNNNVFVSYGLANIFIGICIIYLVHRIGKKLQLSVNAILLIVIILLCPYIGTNYSNVNDLGYFSCVWVSAAFYSVKVLHTLIGIDCFYEIENIKGKISKIGVAELFVNAILCFITGASSGIHLIVTVFFPLFFYRICRILVEGRRKKYAIGVDIYVCLSMIIIYLGKLFSEHILNFQVRDSNITVISLTTFWKNLGSIIMGYVSLLNGLPYDSDVAVLSVEGIRYLCSLMVVLISIISFLYVLRKLIEENNWEDRIIVPVYIIVVNIGMFLIVNMTYGSAVYEDRYLITIFIMLVFCVGKWIDSLKRDGGLKQFVQILLLIIMLINIVISDKSYVLKKNNMELYDEFSKIAENEDVSVVYFFGNPNLDLEIIQRNLRVYDTNVIYKWLKNDDNQNKVIISHWGDYTDLDNREDYDGKILLCVSAEDYENMLFDEKNKLQLVANLENVQIYTCSYNIFGNSVQ